MKNKWNRRAAALAAAALILTVGAAAGRAIAYFTTYVVAQGGKELELGFTTTEPIEKIVNGAKEITIKNTGENDCYVRVKAFAGNQYTLTFVESESDSRWRAGADGYYYWTEVLPAGENGITGVLKIKIDCGDTKADSFNVIVVQECTPVPYDQDGNIVSWDKVDWNREADVVKTETSTTVKPETPEPDKQPETPSPEEPPKAPGSEGQPDTPNTADTGEGNS